MYDRAPRMLPHAYEPVKVDVAVEHTPEKVGWLQHSRGVKTCGARRGECAAVRVRGRACIVTCHALHEPARAQHVLSAAPCSSRRVTPRGGAAAEARAAAGPAAEQRLAAAAAGASSEGPAGGASRR